MTLSFIKYERDKLSERQAYLTVRADEPDTGLAAQKALRPTCVREVVPTKATPQHGFMLTRSLVTEQG